VAPIFWSALRKLAFLKLYEALVGPRNNWRKNETGDAFKSTDYLLKILSRFYPETNILKKIFFKTPG
jgi:hypothetical protein